MTTRELKRAYTYSKPVLDSMNEPIAVIDVHTFRIIIANTAFLRAHGLREEEAESKTCYEITHKRTSPCMPPHDRCPLRETVSFGMQATAEHVHHTAEGDNYLEIVTTPIRDKQGNIAQALHIQRDISHRKKAEEQIRFLAYYDTMTRLPNRLFLKELFTRTLTSAKRYSRSMAALFIDLDSFKRVNDISGHDIGDQLLRAVAERLSTCVRNSDFIARADEEGPPNTVSRIGGDEFIVLLSDISHGHNAAIVARRILNEFSRPFLLCGSPLRMTASIGISLYPPDGDDVDTLLNKADLAMYTAKARGKNNYRFFTNTPKATAAKQHFGREL